MAEIRETHSGLVVLVGDRAYKAKKAITTDFLDFSTAARREAACAREIELNSRLAAPAYLGIAHLDGPGPGESEPVVVMHRYPDSARLAARLDAATIGDELDAVARVLAEFHAGARRGADIDAEAAPAAVARRWAANIAETTPFVPRLVDGATLEVIAELTDRYLRSRAALFADRISHRRIVDGHADLLADDIFWTPDGPVLLDCLDFDDRLRYVDGIDDAAFLAMDLEFLGHPEAAEQFLRAYRRRAGDPAPRSLVDFYIAYRAVVRAKVECIRADQGHPESAVDAQRHLRIAAEHLRAAVPRLVLVGGGPGTGKSTVSRGLAERVGAEVISTDDVRKEMLGGGELAGPAGVVNAGLYTPDRVAAVYDAVLRRAESALSAGESVVLDGTFRDPAVRAAARRLADRTGAAMVEVVCELPLAVAQERIAHRVAGTSDATAEVAAALAGASFGDWTGAHRVDTGGEQSEVVDDVVAHYRRAV